MLYNVIICIKNVTWYVTRTCLLYTPHTLIFDAREISQKIYEASILRRTVIYILSKEFSSSLWNERNFRTIKLLNQNISNKLS